MPDRWPRTRCGSRRLDMEAVYVSSWSYCMHHRLETRSSLFAETLACFSSVCFSALGRVDHISIIYLCRPCYSRRLHCFNKIKSRSASALLPANTTRNYLDSSMSARRRRFFSRHATMPLFRVSTVRHQCLTGDREPVRGTCHGDVCYHSRLQCQAFLGRSEKEGDRTSR